MNRRLCDQVMMYVPSQDDTGVDLPAALLAHIDACPECRALIQTKTAVSRALDGVRIDPIAKRRLEVQILSRRRPDARSDGRFITRLSGAVAAAFSLVLLLSLSAGILLRAPRDKRVPSDDEFQTESPDSSRIANASKSTATVSAPLPAPRDESLMLSQGASLWMKKGTKLEILNDSEKLAKTRVKNGRIVVDIRRHPKGFRFVVETPSAEVEALGTVFSVNVSPSGEETVRVVESAVLVRPRNGGEPSVVRAGEQLVLGISQAEPADEEDLLRDLNLVRGAEDPETLPPAVALDDIETASSSKLAKPEAAEQTVPTAVRIAAAIDNGQLEDAERLLKQEALHADDEEMRLLFKLAGAYRSRRQYTKTVAVYEHLVSAYPGRDAAVNTLVSIAQIKQGFLKDPAGAIYYYDKYLKKRPRGILAEAASAGKVRALFSLRQWQDLLEASAVYLETFPSGISRSEVIQKRARAEKQLDKVL